MSFLLPTAPFVMELLSESISFYNVAWTILLALCMIYWVSVIVGLADMDFLDIDMDFDADGHVDGDATVDPDGALYGILKFFNMGEVPLMVILTVFALSGWVINVLLNFYLNPGWGWLAAVFTIPAMIGGLIMAKIVTTPMISLYKNLGHKGEEAIDFLGRLGVITLSVEEGKMGQAEILVVSDPMIVNVKSKKGVRIGKGTKIIVVDEGEGKNYYWVDAYETIE